MVAIPTIYRDRLASSVVGTPGVDTSTAKELGAVAETAGQIGEVAGQYAAYVQQNRDVAEQNRLFTDYKMKSVNDLETIKRQYADNPEAAGPVFAEMLKRNLSSIVKQASNSRVAMMLGRGDSYYDGIMVRQQQLWAYDQRERLDKAAVVKQGNDLANMAESIGGNETSLDEKMKAILPLASATGNLTAGAFAAAHPDSAAELQARMLPTLYTRAFYGMMKVSPAQALTMTENPDVQKAFEQNPKELDAMHELAIRRLAGLANEVKWHQMVQPLLDNPKIFNDIIAGKVDWNAIEKMPPGPLREAAQKIALDTSAENVNERNDAVAKYYTDAARIGANYRSIPAGKSVEELVNFQKETVQALADKIISQQTYGQLQAKLEVPLRNALLQAQDPHMLNRVKQAEGGIWGLFKNEKAADRVVADYVSGYNTINKWLKAIGKDKDYEYMINTFKNYHQLYDSATPESRDAQGRPYTAVSIARKAMGISVGDILQTRLGPRKIVGYREDGMPMMETTKEDEERLNTLRFK